MVFEIPMTARYLGAIDVTRNGKTSSVPVTVDRFITALVQAASMQEAVELAQEKKSILQIEPADVIPGTFQASAWEVAREFTSPADYHLVRQKIADGRVEIPDVLVPVRNTLEVDEGNLLIA